jgi:hypothetical protein
MLCNVQELDFYISFLLDITFLIILCFGVTDFVLSLAPQTQDEVQLYPLLQAQLCPGDPGRA